MAYPSGLAERGPFLCNQPIRHVIQGDMISTIHKSIAFVVATLAVFLAGGRADVCAQPRIDNVPMYGLPEIPRPEAMRKLDEEFIARASAGFGGNREAAGQAWFKEGEAFMSKGNLDFAMRRYNQAWLLTPNSYKPYWGFARVPTERSLLDDAIKYFEKAKQLCDDKFQRAALLSDAGSAYADLASKIDDSHAEERERYFMLSNQNFQEGTALDPAYPNIWRRWAIALYIGGKYSEAWEMVAKAKAMKAPPFPPAFLDNLKAKLPEPTR